MEEKILSPLKCCRLKCLDCCGGSSSEVALCDIESCALFPHRFGKSVTRKGRVMSQEQKDVSKARLLEYHAKRKASKELPE